MSSEMIIKVLLSSIEFIAMFTFFLALFRMPIKHNILKIILVAVIMAILVHFLRSAAPLFSYALITALTCQIIFVMLVFRLPLFYSLLLCTIGSLTVTTIEIGLLIAGQSLHITSPQLIGTNILHLAGNLLLTAFILGVLSFWMMRTKRGFVFNTHRFALKEAFKGYYLLLTVISVLNIVVLQAALLSVQNLVVTFYLLGGQVLILLISIYYTYRHNKKQLHNKYERLDKR
jgi:hypothetical protein